MSACRRSAPSAVLYCEKKPIQSSIETICQALCLRKKATEPEICTQQMSFRWNLISFPAMENPEQNRRLLRDYTIPKLNTVREGDAAAETDSNEAIHSRRRSFWRGRPWWQYLVLLQLVNIILITLLENRTKIKHSIHHSQHPMVADCESVVISMLR